jgi:signal transduction histidine kinase
VTDTTARDRSAAGAPDGASAAVFRQLLDHAVLAHDMRNSIGVVSMQVEAIAMRAHAAVVDGEAIHGHANTAGDHIERLAAMMNALIAFARGRASSDLAVIFAEVIDLVPLRPVLVVRPDIATVSLDPLLTRAVALEVLALALASTAAPTFTVEAAGEQGAMLHVTSGHTLEVDDAVEWVVQFRAVGGGVRATDDGLVLTFPQTA